MIVLHIGTDKTGSTAIQKMLHWNRDKLKGLGWAYPKSGMMHYDHARLKLALDEGDINPFKSLKKELDESTCENVILSHEGFYTLNADKLRLFSDYLESLGKGKVRVVLYLRRQDEMIESGMLQQIKTHENIPRLGDGDCMPFLAHLDYSSVLSRWQADFGADNITIKPYGKEFFSDANAIYSGFAVDSLGLSEEEYKSLKIPSRDPNPSIDAISAHVISFFNQLGLDRKFFDSISDILLGLQSEKPSNKAKLFSGDERELLLSRYREGNKRISKLLPSGFFDLSDDVKNCQVVTDSDVRNRLADVYLKRDAIVGCIEWFGEAGFVNRVNENKFVLLNGWYDLEGWGAWTNPKALSRLAFRVARTIANGNGISLTFKMMQLESSNAQSFVRVEGNEKWIELNSDVSFILTKDDLQKKSGLIILELKTEGASSPGALGQGQDSRQLGCGIKSLGYTDIDI